MLKNRKILLSSGIIAGLITLNCFCCFFFRTSLTDLPLVTPPSIVTFSEK
jgi:hypothetical protein